MRVDVSLNPGYLHTVYLYCPLLPRRERASEQVSDSFLDFGASPRQLLMAPEDLWPTIAAAAIERQ